MVTLWRIPLASTHEIVAGRMGTLDAHELQRARAFVDAEQGREWSLAHVALRDILGAALGLSAADVRYVREPDGRTTLDHSTELRFSLSHAPGLAVVAVGTTVALGVDVERSRPILDLTDVVQDVFTRAEQDQIAAMTPDAAHRAFLRGWTRKEAVVKALGRGIEAMGQVEVTLGATAPRLVAFAIPGEESAAWSLAEIPLDPPFVGALAVRSPSVHCELRDWTIS